MSSNYDIYLAEIYPNGIRYGTSDEKKVDAVQKKTAQGPTTDQKEKDPKRRIRTS